jgi:ribosome biogenesis GTPase A
MRHVGQTEDLELWYDKERGGDYVSFVIHKWYMQMKVWRNIIYREGPKSSVPLPLCLPRTPHGPACHRVPTSAGENLPELWHCLNVDRLVSSSYLKKWEKITEQVCLLNNSQVHNSKCVKLNNVGSTCAAWQFMRFCSLLFIRNISRLKEILTLV